MEGIGGIMEEMYAKMFRDIADEYNNKKDKSDSEILLSRCYKAILSNSNNGLYTTYLDISACRSGSIRIALDTLKRLGYKADYDCSNSDMIYINWGNA